MGVAKIYGECDKLHISKPHNLTHISQQTNLLKVLQKVLQTMRVLLSLAFALCIADRCCWLLTLLVVDVVDFTDLIDFLLIY